jgi:glucose-1-phosphate adenylyltransferase
MTNRSCIAMLLAGGEGKRLAPLTQKLAKPAVPFGGRYRIIDFPLSNCVNSGISTIGVLTQYRAESLHSHIEDGRHWPVDEDSSSEIFVLPGGMAPGTGYAGTADAIYKNIAEVDARSPEHVLILSGDHIYQMDYRNMLETHVKSGADATIAVKRVPWREASRFGILNADASLRIQSFTEKPAKPDSNLASMGIYLFRWSYLRELLILDNMDASSSHDFGKDLIPEMIRTEASVFAFPFDGYWRDVGTVESLWEAHMDVLAGELTLDSEAWPMHSNEQVPYIQAYTHPLAIVRDSIVHPFTVNEGEVDRSILFGGVHIGRGSSIQESIIMPNVKIGRNVKMFRAIIGEGTIIEDGAVIGREGGDVTALGADELVHSRSASSFMNRTNELLKGIVRTDKAAGEGF